MSEITNDSLSMQVLGTTSGSGPTRILIFFMLEYIVDVCVMTKFTELQITSCDCVEPVELNLENRKLSGIYI